LGILSLPDRPVSRGVLIVVGGPQYRAGSHRQFTLIARDLAEQGIPVMRFDYRGMGDSEGESRAFDEINDDIRAAVNQFFLSVPDLTEVVIFGLCDAASAALFYADQDERIRGLILINPWIRTEEGMAKTYLKHYYFSRLFEVALWRKILRGQFEYKLAIRSFLQLINSAFFTKNRHVFSKAEAEKSTLPARMLKGVSNFTGEVLLILSANDLTAQEFSDYTSGSHEWQTVLNSTRVKRVELAGADHTFSRKIWRDQVSTWISVWIKSW
jgi:exosortase A-associated hydrolase 1